ncbi:putative F-box/LRR-repeat protein At3g18150 [Asparagus officinalis]|uniref:putative F-box/LRR-repeat protein At3g18150 n=1 Tax=Asparagus officinalis TaxID=4686 RepID=UPI00098E7DB3|nr:putative F-box/LRR-repeat protein At3g18150 [Asparagus officinalis]
MARNIDRISDLPDIIRLQILCLLPRKFAARTSALSWRWRDLWRYRRPYETSLIFDEEFRGELTPEEFSRTVDQVLKQRGKKKVEIFHIFFYPGTRYQSNTVSWIEYAISNEVEELYLDFCQGFKQEGTFQIPNGLLQGDSLTVLNLKYCKFDQPVGFRRLKFLETVSLKYVDATDDMVLDVISNCPFLERLDLRQCFELRSIKVSGSNLRLKSLVVVNCWKLDEIEIFAPNLRSFHFNGVFLKSYVFGEISLLSDAMMSSLGREPESFQANWVRIIEDLAHVKVLTLCSRALEVII